MNMRKRVVLLGVYCGTIVFGTLPYVVLNFRGEHHYDWINLVCGLLRVPSTPLALLVGVPGALMFGMDFDSVSRVMVYAAPFFLALLYWPFPALAFAPGKFSRPIARTFVTAYSILVLCGIGVGMLVMAMIVNSPR
jgi:hypothetical protein